MSPLDEVSAQNARMILCLILMIIGLVVLTIGIALHTWANPYHGWQHTDSTVISVDHTTSSVGNSVGGVSLQDFYAPTITFVANGSQQTYSGAPAASTYNWSKPVPVYRVGQVIPIIYKPDDTTQVCFASQAQAQTKRSTLPFFIAGTVITILGGCLLGSSTATRRKRSQQPPHVVRNMA
jgi:uncharacterized membrane protein